MRIYPQRFTAFVCLIAAMAWGLAMSGSAQAFTFEKIADNSGDFETFGLPDLNDAGQVVFSADEAGVSGVYVASPGGMPELVVDTSGTFDSFDVFPRINNSGVVVVAGNTDLGEQAIVTGTAGGSVDVVAETNGTFASLISGSAISDDGTVAFGGTTDPTATGTTGIYTRQLPDPIETLEDDSGPFEGFFVPFINHQGDVSYFARDNGGSAVGVYNHKADGTRTLIVDNTGEFSGVLPYSAPTSDGRVAVRGVRPDSSEAIIVGDGGPLTILAETGGEFQNLLSDLAINDNGLVAFNPRLTDSGNQGLYYSDGTAPRRVIGPGDALFGSTVTDVLFTHGLNELNRVAFLYVLDNDEIGIAVTTIPEPRALGLLAIGVVVLLAIRAKRCQEKSLQNWTAVAE